MRIFVGPVEVAGIAITLTKAFRKLGVEADSILFLKSGFNYPVDKCLNLQNKNKLLWPFIVLDNFIKSIFCYDSFLFIYGVSLLPWNLDLLILKILRKKIGVIFCGSDIRCCKTILKEGYKYSLCDEEGYRKQQHLSTRKRKRKAYLFQKYADIILSLPENSQLLKKNYEYFWLPLDLEEWSLNLIQNKIPIIVHAPTNRMIKGTKYVLDAVEKLKKEGYKFKFVLLENVSRQKIKNIFKNCDIVIDQLISGWYGQTTVEAMALGKPVLCYIREDLKKYSPELPILSTDPDNIYDNLKFLIQNVDLCLELGKKGRKYVEDHHNSIKVAKDLLKIYNCI